MDFSDTNPSGGAAHDDRRQMQRVPLDMPCFIRMQRHGSSPEDAVQVVLRDISQSGAQIGLPPAVREMITGGDKVYLRDFPKHFSMLEGTPGKIVWSGSGACGILFDEPLTMSQNGLLAISMSL